MTGVLYATDHFPLPLPPGHRFPLAKYARLRERVAARVPDLLAVAPAATDGELGHAHDAAYVMATSAGTLDADAQRRIGFPWSPAMVERSRRSAGATLAACRTALATGCAVNLAGGTHHAHRDFGAGFCVFNDAAVAARAMQAEGRIRRALVVDLDVHQGDGTASIFAGDASVFTFSIHGRDNFPFRKAASDLDIELADGTGDDAYLRRCRRASSARSTVRGRSSRSTSPVPIPTPAIASAASRSPRPVSRPGTARCSMRCRCWGFPWPSRWPAATPTMSTTSSTSTWRPSARRSPASPRSAC